MIGNGLRLLLAITINISCSSKTNNFVISNRNR